jgi:4-amino-4-deoxy-L-arabinose transferase-like glycosyltransferase
MDSSPAPSDSPSPIRAVLTALAALLLFIALLLLYNNSLSDEPNLQPALILIVAGLVVFLIAEFSRNRPVRFRLPPAVRWGRRGAWIAAAVVLSVLTVVTTMVFLTFGRQNYLPVLILWFGAAAAYLAAFLERTPSREELITWWRTHRMELLALGLLVALAAGLRFYKLGEVPRVINGDEGWLGSIALSTVQPPYANPFALWENFGALYLQAINWGFVFFGASASSLRLMPALAGILAVPALYLLGRQIAGRRVAFLAAFLLAISHSHLNFSRSVGVGYIQDTWLVPMELYFLLSGLQKRSPVRAAAGGLLLGIHFSIYLTPQIFAGMLLVFSVLLLAFFRNRYPQAPGILAAFWAGMAIMLLPEAVYAVTHSNEFFNRLNQDGTFQSGWLVQQMASTGKSAIEILSGRVMHAFLSLIAYPSIDFYGSLVSVLSLFAGVFFLAGTAISLRKTRSLNFLLLNGYFWAGPLAIGLFSIPQSADSYRILMVLPAAMLLAAIGLDSILDSLGVGWDRKRTAYAGIGGFILLSLLAFNLWTYFVDFAGKCRYGGDPQTRFASYLGKYLATLGPMDSVFLLSNDVYWYGTHPSVDFLSGGKTIVNVPDNPDSIDPVAGDILIASPDRIEELLAWAHDHPGGHTDAFFDCKTLFLLAYHVP